MTQKKFGIANERGQGTLIFAVIISLIVIVLLTSISIYTSNRTAWQAKIREAYRMTFVLEEIGKYVKDAYDRAEACRKNTNVAARCDGTTGANQICRPAGSLPAPLNWYEGVVDNVGDPSGAPIQHFFCFTPISGCGGTRLGIEYTDSLGTEKFCLQSAQVLTASNEIPQRFMGYAYAAKKVQDVDAFAEMNPLDRWQARAEKIYGDWGQTTEVLVAQLDSPQPTYTTDSLYLNLIDSAYAAAGVGGGARTRDYNPVMTNQTPYSIRGNSVGGIPACNTVDPEVASKDSNCNRKCSTAMPCYSFGICPTWIAGGCNGSGGQTSVNTKLIRGSVQLF